MTAVEITSGIKVSVETFFQAAHSDPAQSHFVFAYRVTIENVGDSTVKLKRRQWFIVDSNGVRREVEGEGVVGNQPVLLPGKSYSYVSGCNFNTEIGRMHGTYLMERITDGKLFYVKIPRFEMVAPFKLN